ncbi:MAG TPA: MlaD family protein [Polyangiaceae bacterium]|nr:MlaD family protein [Polyangiaceae bacterium]
MAKASTHFKLGLFTLLGLTAALVTAFVLGVRGTHTDTIDYHTYFDESVQGLDVGAPVKYRGVQIGSVADIAIAPDDKHVDVTMALNRERIQKLKVPFEPGTPRLRAQLNSQGITGVKFIDIDFFDPKAAPRPKLPFEHAKNYIPATPSLFKGLEDNLEAVGQRLPELVDVMTESLKKIDSLLGSVQDERIASRVAKILDGVDVTVADADRVLRHFDTAGIPNKTASALDDLSRAIANVNGMLERIGGDGGLVASTQRATESIGDLGRSTNTSAQMAGQTLKELDQAARSLRDLADSLERDPQMLLQGHAAVREP